MPPPGLAVAITAPRVYKAAALPAGPSPEDLRRLFADRTPTRKLAANQLRLYVSAFAYVMMETLRCVGVGQAGTKWARAQSWTIRLKLLKIGAHVRVTTRKVWLSFSESYPHAVLLRTVLARLQALPLRC